MLEWYREHQREIGYFIAGWCSLAALTDFINSNYLWAAIDAGLVYLNIKLVSR